MSPDPGPAVNVTGLVVDERGEPVPLAILTAPGSEGTLTDAGGRFSLWATRESGGHLSVLASKPGCREGHAEADGVNSDTKADVRITLVPSR